MKRISAARGFSLLETIAVLVIIGVIIGGIWLTYSSVNKQKRAALYEQGMSSLLNVVRNYVGQYNETAVPNVVYNYPSNSVRNITSQLAPTGKDLFPVGIMPAALDPNTFEMDGGIIGNVVTATSGANPYNSGPLVGIRLTRLRRAVCIDILNIWGGSQARIKDSGMVAIIMQTSPFGAGFNIHDNNLFATLPANALSLRTADITAACNQGQNNIVTFFYRVNL